MRHVDDGSRFHQFGGDMRGRRFPAQLVEPLDLLVSALRDESRREQLAECGVVAPPTDPCHFDDGAVLTLDARLALQKFAARVKEIIIILSV